MSTDTDTNFFKGGFMRPYIGVTGITNAEQTQFLAKLFPREGYMGPEFRVGILASDNTLQGQPNYSNRYPKLEEIRDIFCSPSQFEARVRQFIHYNTHSHREALLVELLALSAIAPQTMLAGIQLNMGWPELKVLERFHKVTRDGYDFTIQLNRDALRLEVEPYSPQALVQRAKGYQFLASHFLFDVSGSRGKFPRDGEKALIREYVYAFKEEEIDATFAGGLSAESLETVRPLLAINPSLSIDAERWLRNTDDHLDLEKASSYIRKSLNLYLEMSIQHS